MYCEYCDNTFRDGETKCYSCGAPRAKGRISPKIKLNNKFVGTKIIEDVIDTSVIRGGKGNPIRALYSHSYVPSNDFFQYQYDFCSRLPNTGKSGVIYCIQTKEKYEEYVYNDNKFELIGCCELS